MNLLSTDSASTNRPECSTHDKCRFVESGTGAMTAAYYPPIYDRDGRNTNPDRNTISSQMRCMTCGKTK